MWQLLRYYVAFIFFLFKNLLDEKNESIEELATSNNVNLIMIESQFYKEWISDNSKMVYYFKSYHRGIQGSERKNT